MHALPFSQAGSTEGGQNQNVSIQNPCLFYVLRNGDNFPGNNFLKVFPLSSESMMNFPHWRREKTENSHQRHKSGPAPLSQLLSSVLDHRGMGVCVCDYCFPLFSWPSTFAPVVSWGLNSTLQHVCRTKLSVKGISLPPWCGWDISETADLPEVNTSKWNIREASAGSSIPEMVFH